MNKRYFLCIVLFSLNPQFANAACSPSVSQMLNEPMEALLETPISVASNVSLDLHQQPASVTVISREQLQLSAARTLNEALMTYVPGYFVVEGHSDTVAAFRGLVGDSNAKIMMLVNGHNINAERYGGMPDGIINSTNFDWIERIEVVRGPGSVTLGQGALQGVINIITRSADSLAPECGDAKVSLISGGGLNNLWQGGVEAAFNHKEYDGYLFVQQKNYDGQNIRRQGWAAEEMLIGDSAGSVVADVGHRLKRTDNLSIFGQLRYGQFSLDVLHVNQMRDMYFFMRDSDGIGEELNYVGLNHNLAVTNNIRLESKLDAAIDDALQYTVQNNRTAGGNREIRYGVKEILHVDNLWEGNKLALGSEARFYELGLNNLEGANFLINNFSLLTGETMSTLNQKYGFVFPSTINLYSFFIEDYNQLNDWLSIFGGLRFDEHQYWGDHLSPRAGVFITPWQAGQFRVSYQEGFRGAVGLGYSGGYEGDGFLSIPNLPQLNSLQMPGYNNIGTVKPEVLQTWELAFNQQLNKRWQFENVLFYSKALNMIGVDAICGCNSTPPVILPTLGHDMPSDNWYWFYINKAGSKEQLGFETSIRYLAEPFNITASHSLVEPLTMTTPLVGELALPAIAQHVTRFNMVVKPWAQVSLGVNYLFYPSWNAPNSSSKSAEGAHLLNASIMYSPVKPLELSMSVKNILGENNLYPMIHYVDTPGAPAIESTTFWLSTRINLF